MHAQFLGTAGYHPSDTRHTSGILIGDASPEDAFLLDAGTGTFRLIDIDLPHNLHVFLSHGHLDHVCGLTFLFDVAWNRNINIHIYGDQKTLCAIEPLFDSPIFPLKNDYDTTVVTPGIPLEVAGVTVNVKPLTHPGGSLAYRFDWPEISMAYVTDTVGDDLYFDLIDGVDILIHERNFDNELQDLADLTGHCTSAALIRAAEHSGAKRVFGTHFNPRTKTDPLVPDDVYNKIPGVVAAYDGLEFEF